MSEGQAETASVTSGIVLYPNALLLRRSVEVLGFNQSLRNFVTRMYGLMYLHNGIGLSAVQVGENIRLFIADDSDKIVTMVNPKLLYIGNAYRIKEEGCLSRPGYYGQVARAVELEMQYQDVQGEICRMSAHGEMARIIQHELDHLDGVMFMSRAATGIYHASQIATRNVGQAIPARDKMSTRESEESGDNKI